jgi:hypothetical protein
VIAGPNLFLQSVLAISGIVSRQVFLQLVSNWDQVGSDEIL